MFDDMKQNIANQPRKTQILKQNKQTKNNNRKVLTTFLGRWHFDGTTDDSEENNDDDDDGIPDSRRPSG